MDPVADNMPLNVRRGLLEMKGDRTYEQLGLEFEVWKALRCLYIDGGGVVVGLQSRDRVYAFSDRNVYALVAAEMPRLEMRLGYRLQGRVEKWHEREYWNMDPARYERLLATAHFTQQEWLLAHAFFREGSVNKLVELAQRLGETLHMLYLRLDEALERLCAVLPAPVQAEIAARRAAQEDAIPADPPDPMASMPPEQYYMRQNCMNGYRDYAGAGWHEDAVPQHRLFRLLVFIFMQWIIHEEHSITTENGYHHMWVPSIRRHVLCKAMDDMTPEERAWSGAVCTKEAANLIRYGDTVPGVLQAYQVSEGYRSAGANLHEIVGVMKRWRDGTYVMDDAQALENIARVKRSNGFLVGPYFRSGTDASQW